MLTAEALLVGVITRIARAEAQERDEALLRDTLDPPTECDWCGREVRMSTTRIDDSGYLQCLACQIRQDDFDEDWQDWKDAGCPGL